MLANYYVILGIGPDANAAQIRRAFRHRAHECHPDHNPQGHDDFVRAKEAYDVLSDPAEKKRYDREITSQRHAPREVQSPSIADVLRDFGSYSPSLEEVTDLFAQNFISARQPKTTHARELNVELPISGEEARGGGHVVLGVPVSEPCSACQGSGKSGFYICDECGGRGTNDVTAQLDVLIPRGTIDGTIIPVSLRHLGIRNMNLFLHVRVA